MHLFSVEVLGPKICSSNRGNGTLWREGGIACFQS